MSGSDRVVDEDNGSDTTNSYWNFPRSTPAVEAERVAPGPPSKTATRTSKNVDMGSPKRVTGSWDN